MQRILLLTLFALGCGRGTSPPPQAVAKPSRPRVQSGLFLTCSHVVVDPDLILGVLTVRNVGTYPIALVDRWNSWSASQWWLSVGPQSAGNPQHSWYRNFYTETVIAPGEVRHARFQLTRSRVRGPVRESAWWFLTEGSLGTDESISPFGRGTSVTLTLSGALAEEGGPVLPPAAGLWIGHATVRSTEAGSEQDLEERALGMSLP